MPFNVPVRGALVLVAVLAASPVAATDYYVDRSHQRASDTKPGTEELPWKTIQHAADTVRAGDTVWVKSGIYTEQVRVTRSGDSGEEIVFAAFPGDNVTVDGAGVSLPEQEGLFHILGASHIRISGFHVVNAGPFGSSTGIHVEGCSSIVIEGNQIASTASSGILVWGSTDVLLDGNEVAHAMTVGTASLNECITIGRTSAFEVRGNHVHDGSADRGNGIAVGDGSSDGTVHHNHVHHVAGAGIAVDTGTEHTHDVEVYANLVHDVAGAGIVLSSQDGGLLEHVRVDNNVSYHNRELGLEITTCTTSSSSDDLQVVNNSFSGNGWSGRGGGMGGCIGVTDASQQATVVLVRNNACAGNRTFEIAFERFDPAGATLDHNLVDAWHGYPGGPCSKDWHGYPCELCGSDCQVGDPLWVDPAHGDLHLQVGSPAMDTGSPLLAPSDDLDGQLRPQGAAVDIGAFELAGGSECTLPCGAVRSSTSVVDNHTGDATVPVQVE